MKRILVITVLAVLLMSTVGVPAVMAEGPAKTALSIHAPASADVGSSFDITGTLSYGTASTWVKDRLVTVYQSTDGKKWTEAGTATTDGNGAYTVSVTQFKDVTYSYKAEFAGDKIFKKATSETITVGVNVAGDYPGIAALGLVVEMGGWFVAKIACFYSTDGGVTWKESGHSSGIAMGTSKVAMLRDLGVPKGALVKIHAIVVGGKDRTGSEVFRYDEYSWWYANYWIKGTTSNPTLTYHEFALIQ